MKKFLSIILAILMIVITVPFAFAAESDTDGTTIVITMTDSYGDGWSGNGIQVGFVSEGVFTKIADATIETGATATYETIVSDDKVYAFRWTKGLYLEDCSFTISVDGEIVFEKSDCSDFSDDEMFYVLCEHNFTDSVCSICGLTCGVDFSHNMNGGVECISCGFVCSHNYTNHYCKACGKVEDGYYGGVCGANDVNDAIWSLDSEGTLTISGEGEYDVPYLNAPWKAYGENIKNVVIEEGITNIEEGSFYDLPNTVTLSIPSTVTTITVLENNGFAEIKVADGNNYYRVVDDVLFNYNKTELIMYPAKKADETYTVPDGVTILGRSAFYALDNLKTLNICDDVTTIKDNCFSHTHSIENINFGENVEVVEYSAFYDTGLKTVVLPEKLTEISYGVFWSCYKLETLVIGSKVTSIDSSVIRYCDKLKTVHFTGTEEQWQAITKPDNSEDKINTVAVHFGALEEKDATEAACGEAGHTAGFYCDECNAYLTGEEIPADADAHDWSNLDGICANGCGLECDHKYYNQERIRPVQNADGTWNKGTVKAICSTCGFVASEKEVERDHEGYAAFEEAVAELEALFNREDLIDGPKNEYISALNNLKNAAYSLVYMDDEETMMRIKAIADSYISEVEAGLADGTMKKADWTYMTELFEEINAIIDNDYHNIISSMNSYYLGPQGYYNGCSNSPTFTQASYNGNIHFEKQLETLLAGLQDGSALKADYTYIDGVIEKIEEKFADEYLTDERKAELEQIKSDIEKLKVDPDTSVADLEGLERSVYNIFTAADACFNGYHSGLRYELTEEAKCGKNAVESAICSSCSKVLTREVENTALTHSFTKYEVTEEAKCGVEGKEVAYCDNGCGETDEKAIEALKHSFVDYIYNEDATCEANGTKTAECANGCGETDTVEAEDTMLEHADEDGDKICDDCQAEIVDVCPDCGYPVHAETGIPQYICMLITLIKLVVSLVKALQAVA